MSRSNSLYGNRWREFAPLNDTERSDILRAAICYALSEESIGVARLREKYEAKFSDGADRRAFGAVATAPIGASGTEFQDIAKKVASVDTLDAFLRDISSRYPEASAAPPAGAAGEGGSPAAEFEAKPTTNGAASPPRDRNGTRQSQRGILAIASERPGRRAAQARQRANWLDLASENARDRSLNEIFALSGMVMPVRGLRPTRSNISPV